MHDAADIGRWLALLRDGSEAEQQLARTELGLILEARGLLDDAAEAYARNIQEGVTDRRPYERLAAIARLRGDAVEEARLLRALADLLAPPLEPMSIPEPEPQADGEETPLTPHPPIASDPGEEAAVSPYHAHGGGGWGEGVPASSDLDDEAGDDFTPELVDLSPAEISAPPEDEPAPVIIADDDMADSDGPPPADETDAAVGDEPSLAATAPVNEGTDATAPEKAPEQDQSPAAETPETEALTEDQPAAVTDAVTEQMDPPPPEAAAPDEPDASPDATVDWPPRPLPLADDGSGRADQEDANKPDTAEPAPADTESRPARAPFSRLVATLIGVAVLAVVGGIAMLTPIGQPAPSETIQAQAPTRSPSPIPATQTPESVAPGASPSPAASPSPVAVATLIPAASPTLTPAPLAARCADAALRFPESTDTAAAVRTAFREFMARQGVTADPASTLFAGLSEAYAERHAEVVAGWMAVILQRERRGLPAFPLVDYVSSDVIVAAGPGNYQQRATISPQGWTELRALSADTCEGAFMRNPANARWVELMEASVGDITWAIPTPTRR